MSTLLDKATRILNEKTTKILPENIKKDLTVFGVTGTLQPGSTVTGVKLFDTVEHMQNDETAQEGDLAVVYREEIQPVSENSEFDSCIFPNEVVLDEAFTGDIWGSFRSTGDSYFDGNVEMSSSRFRFRGRGESGNINVQYTSSDGITYTRTDGGEELQEFGTTIKWESWGDPWNDVIGNFMKIGGNYFEGLYKYAVGLVDSTKLYWCNVSDCTITWSETRNQVTSFVVNAKTNNYIDGNVLKQLIPDIQALYSATIKNVTFFLNTSDELCFVMTSGGGSESVLAYNKTSGNLPVGIGQVLGSPGREATLYKVNSSLTSFTKIRDISTVSSGAWEYTPLTDIKTIPITVYITGEVTSSTRVSTSSNFDTTITNPIDCKSYYNCYLRASTQLDATSDYIYEKTFYGKNGVETGTLTTNISSDFSDINNKILSSLMLSYNDLNTVTITNRQQLLPYQNTYILPAKLDGTPIFDFSELTTAYWLFSGFRNLESVSNLDFSSCTSFGEAFGGCSNLKVVDLDTHNVTTFYRAFSSCTSLTEIPKLDFTSATNLSGLFWYCENLEDATDFGDYDTSNITIMDDLFHGCYKLVHVPVFNTSSTTTLHWAFEQCTLLDNESLNNVMQMCITAVSVTHEKTLKYVGLTSDQATRCQSLSNYSALINAGWTTGY